MNTNKNLSQYLSMLVCVLFISISLKAQYGINKSHISKAYNSLKLTANFPETWSLKDYAVYEGKRERKCIDIAIIEINAINGFGVPISGAFICYFINGRMFWYTDTKYKTALIQVITEEYANKQIDIVLETAINIEKTVTRQELCKSSKEEEEERIRLEQQKEAEKLAALKKIEEEKERIEHEKQNSIAQSYMSGLISEKHFYQASQYYSLNSLKYDLNKFYIPIKNGLADSLSKDTLTLSSPIVNQFIINNKVSLCNLSSGPYTFNINTQGYISGNYDVITDVPYKTFGITNVENLKVGDRYLGGVIIKIKDNDILLSSPRPIGSGPFDSAIELCSKYQLGGLVWRMPTPEELNSVFDLKNKLEHYENNWYWTSVMSDQSAQHLGIQRRDMAYVPKKDGKWVFAVSTISYFKVPINSKMNIIINEVKDSLIKIEYTSSSDKPIYNKDNTDFFYKSKNSLPICQYSQDQSLPKNLIRLKRHMESYKQANGVLLKGEHKVITTDYLIKKKE
jgi:hypothetical protein